MPVAYDCSFDRCPAAKGVSSVFPTDISGINTETTDAVESREVHFSV